MNDISCGKIFMLRELFGPLAPSPGDSIRVLGKLISMNQTNSFVEIEHGTARLKVDVSNIQPERLQLGSLFQFIGELAQNDAGLYLRARVARNVDGLDIGLYEEALQLRRTYATQLNFD